MAKRKRLTPAAPLEYAPETKAAYPLGVAPTRSFTGAPIADVAQETAATAALQEVSDTLRMAREKGRLVLELPLAAVDESYLVRDRTRIDDDEMAALRTSIRERGQQTPIEVIALGADRYGLISGWRRLAALRDLSVDVKNGGLGTVLALLRQPADSADAYLAMVEENEIRVGLSYYERARIAARSVDQGVFETHKAALLSLFRSASRAKRSKIRSFLGLVSELDTALRFPEDIGERLGLQIAQALDADPTAAKRFRAALKSAAPEDAAAEKACLEALLKPAVKQTPKPTSASADRQAPRAGIEVVRRADGQITLQGSAVDDRLYKRLLAFLTQDG